MSRRAKLVKRKVRKMAERNEHEKEVRREEMREKLRAGNVYNDEPFMDGFYNRFIDEVVELHYQQSPMWVNIAWEQAIGKTNKALREQPDGVRLVMGVQMNMPQTFNRIMDVLLSPELATQVKAFRQEVNRQGRR